MIFKNNKRNFIGILFIVTGFISLLPTTAFAVPAFARQMKMPCQSCHFQNFPALNSFGRMFRASGYTMGDPGGFLQGEDLSLPSNLNMSIATKIRYDKSNGNTAEGKDFGQIGWPDEAAFLVGGRLSEDIGFLMELGLAGTGLEADPQGVGGHVSGDTQGNFLSTKIHFNVGKMGATQFSVIPFSTDGLGAGYGFELLNTGAQRSQRPIEERSGYSAANTLGLLGEATGIALVASSNNYYINYSLWTPGWAADNMAVNRFAGYFRGVYMPTIGGWDVGIGTQIWFGHATVHNEGAPGNEKPETEAWIIDAQAQGTWNDMPLGVYASYGSSTASTESFWNNNPNDANAFGILGKLGVIPNKTSIFLAYRTKDNGHLINETENAITFGAQHMLAQNVKLELFFVSESGSGVDARSSERDFKYVLQLFAGF